MAFFKRNKGKGSKGRSQDRLGEESAGSSSPKEASMEVSTKASKAQLEDEASGAGNTSSQDARREISPQRVGVVSELPPRREYLRAVEDRLEEELDLPRLEVDPMAHIGHETTITGNIVAQEDLEIQGTIEGSIRLADHQLTVASGGLVKASVEAHTVLVMGRISGDVVASELIEIKAGGVIGGDVKSPRVIMHDGGVVVGGLDMSAALPSSARSSAGDEATPERPRLIRVEPSRDRSKDGDHI